MNFVKNAREAIATYETVGNVPMVELQEVLAVLIGPKATPDICGKLAAEGVVELSRKTVSELEDYGLTKLDALKVQSAILFAEKMRTAKSTKNAVVRSPEDGADYVMEQLRHLQQEHLIALYLNTKNEILGQDTVFIGSLNASIVHPREVFEKALKRGGVASLIIAHNHPSGDPTPSQEDIQVTRRIVEAGKIIGIGVLDHLIIGDGTFVSLKEKGHL